MKFQILPRMFDVPFGFQYTLYQSRRLPLSPASIFIIVPEKTIGMIPKHRSPQMAGFRFLNDKSSVTTLHGFGWCRFPEVADHEHRIRSVANHRERGPILKFFFTKIVQVRLYAKVVVVQTKNFLDLLLVSDCQVPTSHH